MSVLYVAKKSFRKYSRVLFRRSSSPTRKALGEHVNTCDSVQNLHLVERAMA